MTNDGYSSTMSTSNSLIGHDYIQLSKTCMCPTVGGGGCLKQMKLKYSYPSYMSVSKHKEVK